MNKATRNFLILALASVLAACQPAGTGSNAAGQQEGDLVGARIGGAFTLTSQDGKPVSWSDFGGKYRLVYFGYTYCPDVCPLDLRDIMAGYRMFERSQPARAARLQPIFITVDPERDTPAVLKTFVGAFHPRLLGLTGTPAEIDAVKKLFVVVSGKEGDPKATKDYLVNHSRTPYLFGPDGQPIALVPIAQSGAKEDASARAVNDFLNRYVQ